MKICMHCASRSSFDSWQCPECQQYFTTEAGFYSVLSVPLTLDPGFNPKYFEKLNVVEKHYFWFLARNKLIAWALKKYFPNSESFLEIGCGTGHIIVSLKDKFPSLTFFGSELFIDGLQYASLSLNKKQLFQMDARNIPFENEFDVIGAFDVLEHIVEDDLVLSMMYRAIRPGGGLLITVPHHPFLWSASDVHACHQRRYTLTELVNKVQNAGFIVKKVTAFVSFLLPVLWFSRIFCKKTQHDIFAEFAIPTWLNRALGFLMQLERKTIECGVQYRWGASLLLVVQKPKM